MGQLEPLISQALGRSPYDDVVPGDPDAPADPQSNNPQMYDERGRPVNEETRRINRDIIRSHNEVMQVIGVAEPDTGAAETQAQALANAHGSYENSVGNNLDMLGGVLGTSIAWGVSGVRQRVLLYDLYSQVPFHELFRLHRQYQSWPSYLYAGLPSFIVGTALLPSQLSRAIDSILGSILPASLGDMQFPYLPSSIVKYIRIHLEVFSLMQRVGIISPTAFLPGLAFFWPGSTSSPFYIPSLPSPLTYETVLQWSLPFACGAAPFVGYFFYGIAMSRVSSFFTRNIEQRLPQPRTQSWRVPLRELPPPPPSVVAGGLAEEQPRNAGDIARDESISRAHEGQPAAGGPPAGPVRRQSTASARGDEFSSDDEGGDIISATLISFDVEASEANDTHHGAAAWSAELRPNMSENRAAVAQEPRYRVNALTTLPSRMAADFLGAVATRIVTAPLASVIWTGIANCYLARGDGLAFDALAVFGFTLSALPRWSWQRTRNLLGIELMYFTLRFGAWGLTTSLAKRYFMSDEEWEKKHGFTSEFLED
ncbi:hypothetical protein B0T26DRAFT_748410 [Lasiosphaeria miniovina]|uniref:Uncharacterized protein n=1 Tax=Lasiosphaeria miniovina TaxID=1954250 RepID=A0AA40B5M1_9PEZI|nr:uncharacterized protein B0T26DRAFT_748410 [Lasiosphaeria miniovina]KAK0728144.1 hypothetical protein B0T26DRAFT_748410 [Lasiosphaeria miniovina]